MTVATDPRKTGIRTLGVGKANTVVIAGDSLAANNAASASNNFIAVQTCGAFEMANAMAGQRLAITGSVAVGGKTAAQTLSEQIPSVLGLAPKYCYLSAGVNDLYGDVVSGSVTYSRITAILESLLAADITPIWSTVWARASSAGITDDHMWCNDLLRRYAARNNVGIFFDGYRLTQPPGAAFGIRSGWTLDSAPALHVNNLGAYWLGKTLWNTLDPIVGRLTPFAFGPEDQTNSVNNTSNVLVNPHFTGTAGTVSVNCTGTMPDSWTIDWATRTGTGSAAASIVDITDADTGLAISKAIRVTLSGTVANGDILRISQSAGFNTLLSGGDTMNAEGVLTLNSLTNMNEPAMRVQTNGNESTWWGLNSSTSGTGTNEAYPESATFYMKTRDMVVLGTGASSAARYDVRVKFSGAATGTFDFYLPRVRKTPA